MCRLLLSQELAACNRRYEERFGHIFIICASGRSASEMLQALKERCALGRLRS